MVLRPDLADLPYFLRAYFAFKMGLPFGFSKCTRGGGGRPPVCTQWSSIQNVDGARAAEPLPPPGAPAVANASAVPAAPPRSLGSAGSFGAYMRTVGDWVRDSGSARTATADNNTDYYPLFAQSGDAAPGDHIRRSLRGTF